jgi:hypothetical protein
MCHTMTRGTTPAAAKVVEGIVSRSRRSPVARSGDELIKLVLNVVALRSTNTMCVMACGIRGRPAKWTLCSGKL